MQEREAVSDGGAEEEPKKPKSQKKAKGKGKAKSAGPVPKVDSDEEEEQEESEVDGSENGTSAFPTFAGLDEEDMNEEDDDHDANGSFDGQYSDLTPCTRKYDADKIDRFEAASLESD